MYARRGMGDALTACYPNPCTLWDSTIMSNPVTTGAAPYLLSSRCIDYLTCLAGQGIANAYSYVQYGSVPKPLPPPAPNAPQSTAEAAGWTPEQSFLTAEQISDPTRAAINAAIASSAYTPGGTPVASNISDFFSNPWVILGLVLGGMVLLKGFAR